MRSAYLKRSWRAGIRTNADKTSSDVTIQALTPTTRKRVPPLPESPHAGYPRAGGERGKQILIVTYGMAG